MNTTYIEAAQQCGFNFAAADDVTPARAAAAVWSWAPGHPHWERSPAPILSDTNYTTWLDMTRDLASEEPETAEQLPDADEQCVVMASDGRWYRVTCSLDVFFTWLQAEWEGTYPEAAEKLDELTGGSVPRACLGPARIYEQSG